MSNEQLEEQVEDDQDWLEQPIDEELPRRPRRRLLGAGANLTPLALVGVLLTACGFIGGALVEKAQGTSSGSTPSDRLASRVATLRSGGSGGGRGGGFGREADGTNPSSPFGSASGGTGVAVGQVAYVSGHTLYVTDSEGNTVKVKTTVASSVSKTVKSDVKAIHPGETVIVTGSSGANGALSAESIRVSEAGARGGLGALFGGGFKRRSNGSNSTNEPAGAGGEPALFGK